MTIEQMLAVKKEKGYSCRQISLLSGVPLSTVQKLFSGITKTPRSDTIDAISRVLSPESYINDNTDLGGHVFLNEGSSYKVGIPGYTMDDYLNLPDNCRAELIDGVFYDMATPSYLHQAIVGELYIQFIQCSRSHAADCMVFLSPVSVRLDKDEFTMLEPDLIVLCGLTKLPERYFDGAPDLVVEVLSPSTRKKDLTIKLGKYRNAGVRECWIVDPDSSQVMVYDMTSLKFPTIYTFDDDIPVIISNGECTVTLRELKNLPVFN